MVLGHWTKKPKVFQEMLNVHKMARREQMSWERNEIVKFKWLTVQFNKRTEETVFGNVKQVGVKVFYATVSSNFRHHVNKTKENKIDSCKSQWSDARQGLSRSNSKSHLSLWIPILASCSFYIVEERCEQAGIEKEKGLITLIHWVSQSYQRFVCHSETRR